MIDQPPLVFNEREWDRGLWNMVVVSGALHLVAIAVLLFLPYSFAHRAPPLISYTVDLVAPDKVGGTNMVPGAKGRVEGAPLVAAPPAPKVEQPPPPPPKVEEAKAPEPKLDAPKVEPPKAEPQRPKEVEPKHAKEPEAKPKEQPHPKENEAALAAKVKKVEPAAPPSPAKPAAAQPKAVAKAEPPKAAPAAPLKADADAAKKAAAEAAAARQRDERIAAAVKRVEQSGTRGAGSGAKAAEKPGGPVSVGPGQGAGGQLIGVEYLLYYNEMINRIKQSWAWAGADRSLEAIVHFSITESGEVLDVRITHASGDPSYDASVERAVKGVNPLPPPPDAFRKQFSDVELTFSPQSLQM